MLMLFLIGTFGLNFPIFISTMTVKVYHVGASHFGLLSSSLASGSMAKPCWRPAGTGRSFTRFCCSKRPCSGPAAPWWR